MSRGMTAPASSPMWGSDAMRRYRNSSVNADADAASQRLHTSCSAMGASLPGEYSEDAQHRGRRHAPAQAEAEGVLRSHFSELESRGTSTPFICRGWHGYQRTNLDIRQASRRKQRIGYGGRAGGRPAELELRAEADPEAPKSPTSTSRLIDDASVPFLHEFELPTAFGRDLDMLRAIRGGKKVLSPRFQS